MRGPPKWFENRIKMDDKQGYPYFRKPPDMLTNQLHLVINYIYIVYSMYIVMCIYIVVLFLYIYIPIGSVCMPYMVTFSINKNPSFVRIYTIHGSVMGDVHQRKPCINAGRVAASQAAAWRTWASGCSPSRRRSCPRCLRRCRSEGASAQKTAMAMGC